MTHLNKHLKFKLELYVNQHHFKVIFALSFLSSYFCFTARKRVYFWFPLNKQLRFESKDMLSIKNHIWHMQGTPLKAFCIALRLDLRRRLSGCLFYCFAPRRASSADFNIHLTLSVKQLIVMQVVWSLIFISIIVLFWVHNEMNYVTWT